MMEFARIYRVVFLIFAKIFFFMLGFKLNWSPHIVDRDKDFGGLLSHAFNNFSFYKDETQYYALVRMRIVDIVY